MNQAHQEPAHVPVQGPQAQPVAVHVEEHQPLDLSKFMNKPKPFTGKRGPNSVPLNEWIIHIQRFLEGPVPVMQTVAHHQLALRIASSFLQGQAALWFNERWERQKLVNMPAFNTFQEFIMALQQEFTNSTDAQHLRGRLLNIAQKQSSIMAYNTIYRTILAQLRMVMHTIDVFDQPTLVQLYIRGLNNGSIKLALACL
jgi:hypothetical protein